MEAAEGGHLIFPKFYQEKYYVVIEIKKTCPPFPQLIIGMGFLNFLLTCTVLTITLLLSTSAQAASIVIQNKCAYTVWAAAVPGGGQMLPTGHTWTLDVTASTHTGRIWGRTNRTFNTNGTGSCQTGDCGGLLRCTAYGSPPATLAEYSLNGFNKIER